MPVRTLDHVNIRTLDVPGTAAFFGDVLGLETRPAPGRSTISEGCWAYDPGGRPIVHIGPVKANYPSDGMAPFTATSGSGAVHHVALDCEDVDDMRSRLTAAGLTFTESEIPSINLLQIFVHEVNGILLELNFRG